MRPTPTTKRMGENLHHQRILAGFSVEELSRRADIAADTIYRMERGERAIVTDYKHRLASVLNCSPEALEDGIGVNADPDAAPLQHKLRATAHDEHRILRRLASEWGGNVRAFVLFVGLVTAFPAAELRDMYMTALIHRDRLLASGRLREEDLPPALDELEAEVVALGERCQP